MESFKSQFWRQIKTDRAGRDAMEKVPTANHNRVVRLLQAVTDPGTDGRLRKMAAKTTNKFIPSRERLAGLANRMRTISVELEEVAKMPGMVEGRKTILELAKQCRSGACLLDILRPGFYFRHLTYKSFWKPLSTAMLSRELVDSGLLSFHEVEELVRCADLAWGHKRPRAKRSIERQYRGFMKCTLKNASPLLCAAWPVDLSGLLDVMLEIVPDR
jgi:hypothetical protein